MFSGPFFAFLALSAVFLFFSSSFHFLFSSCSFLHSSFSWASVSFLNCFSSNLAKHSALVSTLAPLHLLTGLKGVGIEGKALLQCSLPDFLGYNLKRMSLRQCCYHSFWRYGWEMLNNWIRARSLKGSEGAVTRVYLSVGMASGWQVSNQHEYPGSILHTFVCNNPPALQQSWVTWLQRSWVRSDSRLWRESWKRSQRLDMPAEVKTVEGSPAELETGWQPAWGE